MRRDCKRTARSHPGRPTYWALALRWQVRRCTQTKSPRGPWLGGNLRRTELEIGVYFQASEFKTEG
jgi:hypothetical protein